MRRIRDACIALAQSQLQVSHERLTDAAVGFRERVLALFLPRSSARRQALIKTVASILNGDWRQPCLQHRCGVGCCESLQESQTKVALSLCKLVTGLRPPSLSKGNWSSWSESLVLFGLGGAIHNFLGGVCLQAFHDVGDVLQAGNEVAEPVLPPPPPAAIHMDDGLGREDGVANPGQFQAMMDVDGDKVAQLRQERARSLRIARAFFQGSYFAEVFLMRSALEGTRSLMASLLQAVSVTKQLQDMVGTHGARERISPLLALARGQGVQKMMVTTAQEFMLAAEYLPGTITEAVRSRMLRLYMRPLAVSVQLVKHPCMGFPWKLFKLIDPQLNFQATLDDLLAAPTCLKDPFSSQVLRTVLLQETSRNSISLRCFKPSLRRPTPAHTRQRGFTVEI